MFWECTLAETGRSVGAYILVLVKLNGMDLTHIFGGRYIRCSSFTRVCSTPSLVSFCCLLCHTRTYLLFVQLTPNIYLGNATLSKHSPNRKIESQKSMTTMSPTSFFVNSQSQPFIQSTYIVHEISTDSRFVSISGS